MIVATRHEESLHNRGLVTWADVPNCRVPVADPDCKRARQLGGRLRARFLRCAKHHVSPFLRAGQTHRGILAGAGLITLETPPDREFHGLDVVID